jgi:hypothetical protein
MDTQYISIGDWITYPEEEARYQKGCVLGYNDAVYGLPFNIDGIDSSNSCEGYHNGYMHGEKAVNEAAQEADTIEIYYTGNEEYIVVVFCGMSPEKELNVRGRDYAMLTAAELGREYGCDVNYVISSVWEG